MSTVADFHVHSDYSVDARGSIGEYCSMAARIGLGAICFTTHYDSNPERVDKDAYWRLSGRLVRLSDEVLSIYVREVRQVGTQFEEAGLNVLCGLEIDYYPGVESEVERLRREFPFDFVIGSVHCLENVAISDPREAPGYFSRKTVAQMADDYFELLLMAAGCRGFDCLGHLDYYVRFGRPYYGDDINRVESERYEPIFDALVNNGIGVEINCSPFRRGEAGFHPTERIIDLAVKKGVGISSVGSDCHEPADLGRGVPEGYEMLRKCKIEPLFPALKSTSPDKVSG